MRTIRLVHWTTVDGVEYAPNTVLTVDAATAAQLVSAMRAVYTDDAPTTGGASDPYPQYVTDDELEARLATVEGGGAVLAPVAISGSYTDLLDKPVIPTTAAEIGAASTQEIELASTADRDRANHTGVQPSSTISDFQEAVQDEVANFLGVSGAAISKTYDDETGALILTVTATAGDGSGPSTADLEAMEDAIGAAIIGLGNISVAYADNGDTGRGVLTITTSATQNSTDAALRDRGTHTGTQSADTITDGISKKAYTAVEKAKLAAIEDGATANAPDVELRDRATHTGEQPISSVTGLQEALDAVTAGAGVVTVNGDPGPEVSVTLQNLPDTDVPVEEFSEDGTTVITPGPTPGDVWQVLPSGLHGPGPMPQHNHDDKYAPLGWVAPGTLFGQIVERGRVAPGSAPAGWLIIDKNNPGRLIYQVVETVASAGTTYSIIDPRDVQVTILRLDAADPGCTLVFPGKVPGSEFTLSLRQDSVGGRKAVWPGSTTLIWKGVPGVEPTLQTAPFAEDRFVFECLDGEKWSLKSHEVYAGAAGGAGATPLWIASFYNTSGTNNQATQVPVTYPAVAPGDVGLMHVFVNGSGNAPDTAALAALGWELLTGPVATSDVQLTARAWLFKKLFGGTEDGTVLNVTLAAGSTRFAVTASTFRGVDYDAITVSDPLRTGAVGTTLGVPGVTPPVNNSLLANLAGVRWGSLPGGGTYSVTPSDGWDERADHNEGRATDGSTVQYGGFIQTKGLTGQGNTAQDATVAPVDPKAMYVSWTVALPPPVT